MEEEAAGTRMEREGNQLRGTTTTGIRSGGGGEIEIQMEAPTVGAGGAGMAEATAALTSSGQKGDAEDGLQQTPTWKRFVAHVGPGFLISLAYIDPSNVQTDLQAGLIHKHELLWVLFFGFFFVLVIQSLAAKLGIITGKNLAELCTYEYPMYVNYGLWLLTEVGVIAATVPGVLGTALAYTILLNIPFSAGVLICGASTFLLLGLQTYGVRKLELIAVASLLLITICFAVELSTVNPPVDEVIEGLFIPRLRGVYAMSDAIALFSVLIVPHNLFLHSSLVASRKISPLPKGFKDSSRFFLIENAFAMLLVLLVNVAIVSTTGTICSNNTQLVDTTHACIGLTLNSASILLKNMFGGSTSKIYGLALLASGQSNTVTTSYSGQCIMQGFFRMRKCFIFMIAACVTVIPSLIICSVGGAPYVRQVINISAIILAFVLPFSLVPLLKFSSSCVVEVPYGNSNCIVRVAWILSVVIMGINIYFFCNSFISWLVDSEFPRIVNAIISILVFPFMAAYTAALIYLAFRKVNAAGIFPSSVSVPSGTEVEAWRQDVNTDEIGVH